MADKYLFEAFQALSELNEDVFDVTPEGATKLQDFVSDDNPTVDVENIIDPLATSEEELQDSYIGKAILDCTICQSKIYKDPSDVVIDENEEFANIGEACPYCQSTDGYKVIGQVAPYTTTEVDVEVTTKDGEEHANIDVTTDEKEETEEEEKKEEDLKEDLNGITVDTDHETINITATEKSEDGEEMIAPVAPETEDEFKKDSVEEEEPAYQDIDIDEFAEEDFDELGESYLKKVYENVASYKTTKGSIRGNRIKLEGIITFKSGKSGKTNFVFESKTITKTGKLKFIGENKQFAKGRNAFTLTGKMNGKKLMAESLTYNYKVKNAEGVSKRLYGRVCK